MILPPFRSLRALRRLNVAGVGLALAAVTSVALGQLQGDLYEFGLWGLAAGLPTLLFGTLWAHLLRQRKPTAEGDRLRGWVLSVPLAMANAGVALSLLRLFDPLWYRPMALIEGFFMGVTAGVIVWGPALALTLLFFGVPIGWAQKQAEQGLAGEERGELVVGSTVALLSLGSLVSMARLLLPWRPVGESDIEPRISESAAGLAVMIVIAGLGLACGLASTAMALVRERRRRRFVREVEEGKQAGFRVEPTPGGKVLVRVTDPGKEGYRVSDLDEELFELDAQGLARQPAQRSP